MSVVYVKLIELERALQRKGGSVVLHSSSLLTSDRYQSRCSASIWGLCEGDRCTFPCSAFIALLSFPIHSVLFGTDLSITGYPQCHVHTQGEQSLHITCHNSNPVLALSHNGEAATTLATNARCEYFCHFA
jgi:hypothetical protein